MPRSAVGDALTVFGIRHHGPGCARSLRAALDVMAPDIVLVEGPPDAHDVLPLIMHEEMRPPVALLVYAPDKPHFAAYYPFTVFSPEWQALRYAFEHGVPARFMDLPQAMQLSAADGPGDEHEGPSGSVDREGSEAISPELGPDVPAENGLEASAATADEPASTRLIREDPIGYIARISGYEDRELWWEHQVERRQNATDLFEADV
jgi:hypothetical protein